MTKKCHKSIFFLLIFIWESYFIGTVWSIIKKRISNIWCKKWILWLISFPKMDSLTVLCINGSKVTALNVFYHSAFAPSLSSLNNHHFASCFPLYAAESPSQGHLSILLFPGHHSCLRTHPSVLSLLRRCHDHHGYTDHMSVLLVLLKVKILVKVYRDVLLYVALQHGFHFEL